MASSRGPYAIPDEAIGHDADDITYNPQAEAGIDKDAFDPDVDSEDLQPVGARGAGNQPTARDWAKEDQMTRRSDQTGEIPKAEVDDLLSSATDEEKSKTGRTRGVRVDAYKQENNVDRAFAETGADTVGKEIEITSAVGRK